MRDKQFEGRFELYINRPDDIPYHVSGPFPADYKLEPTGKLTFFQNRKELAFINIDGLTITKVNAILRTFPKNAQIFTSRKELEKAFNDIVMRAELREREFNAEKLQLARKLEVTLNDSIQVKLMITIRKNGTIGRMKSAIDGDGQKSVWITLAYVSGAHTLTQISERELTVTQANALLRKQGDRQFKFSLADDRYYSEYTLNLLIIEAKKSHPRDKKSQPGSGPHPHP